MSVIERNLHSEVRSVTVPTMQIRWWNANMYEMKFPDGTTILMDPFLPNAQERPNWAKYDCGFYPQDIDDEKIDFIFLNHSHGDHIGSLKEVYERYRPTIICHAAYAYRLCQDLDIFHTDVIPVTHDQTLDFGSFKVTTRTCRHSAMKRRPSEGAPDPGTEFETLNEYGAIFNTNYVFTTPNNFRVAFCAGQFEEDEKRALIPDAVNVLLRQCGTPINKDNPELLADQFMATGASVLFPLHHEKCYEKADINEFVAKVNKILADRAYPGQMIFPERSKWYTLSVGAAITE